MLALISGNISDRNRHVVFLNRFKAAFCILCLTPVLWLGFLSLTSGLGPNPIEKVLHTTGDWTLNFLLFTLTITPLCRLTGWSWPASLRKISGLFSFFYATLHFMTYVAIDQGFDWAAIMDDIIQHQRIAVGFASLFLLIPSAVTSIDGMKRRLGYERWKKLPFTVYAAAVGGVVHYLWLVKRDTRRPLVYAVVLLILLGYRVVVYFVKQRKAEPVNRG